jgi:hypothetical protein
LRTCGPDAGSEQEWLNLATGHFDGEVIMAYDLLSLDLSG